MLLWDKLVAKVFIAFIFCFLVDAMGNQGVTMALLRVAKVLLWAKLVVKLFIAIIFCFQVVTMDNQGVAMGSLRVA